MAFSKEKLYNDHDRTTSAFAKALGHPARLAILLKLHHKGPLCVQEIGEDHPISAEALSDHLKKLRKVQLVEWVERFPYTFYSVHEKNMEKATTHVESFLQKFN